MFKDFINLFTKPQDQAKQSIDQTEVLALTAIFIRIAKLDGSFDINEREKIKELVKNRFELNEEKTENVLNMAAKLEGQSNDNIQFTKIIKEMIENHLGWLVIWGAVVGGIIGFIVGYLNL